MPKTAHRSCVGLAQRLHTLDRGCLAGPVRPDDPENLTGGHFEGDPIDGHRVAVALAQPVDDQRTIHHRMQFRFQTRTTHHDDVLADEATPKHPCCPPPQCCTISIPPTGTNDLALDRRPCTAIVPCLIRPYDRRSGSLGAPLARGRHRPG